jgi:TfoX/Sxy family transcriptional regulator of competence genes
MAYDEALADRVLEVLSSRAGADITERHMFGGLAFMVRGHMCCGIVDRELMVRVGPDAYAEALAQPHARPMDFTRRPLTGFVYVSPDGLRSKRAIARWIDRALAYGRRLPAKKTKKTKSSTRSVAVKKGAVKKGAVKKGAVKKGAVKKGATKKGKAKRRSRS